jgi:hypothetical protein
MNSSLRFQRAAHAWTTCDIVGSKTRLIAPPDTADRDICHSMLQGSSAHPDVHDTWPRRAHLVLLESLIARLTLEQGPPTRGVDREVTRNDELRSAMDRERTTHSRRAHSHVTRVLDRRGSRARRDSPRSRGCEAFYLLDHLTDATGKLGSHPVFHIRQCFRVVRQNLGRMNRTQEVRGSTPLSSTESSCCGSQTD